MTSKVLDVIAKERPVGTAANNEIVDYLEQQFKSANYEIQSLPFDCNVWEKGESTLIIDNHTFEVQPSPFSEPFQGSGKLCMVKTEEELEGIDCNGVILIVGGKLTQSPLMPKDYPFYYPEEHKRLISLFEQKRPKAIIAVTGPDMLSGRNPFPLFEDGNFYIPSGNISEETFAEIEAVVIADKVVHLTINSRKIPSKSRQIVASKKSKEPAGKIVIAAHMDTKYNTPGALDNAAGVAVLLQVAEELKSIEYNVDIVPFNSEEYYGACGELEYLKLIDRQEDKIELMINIDSPCHKGAETEISCYNLNDSLSVIVKCVMDKNNRIIQGQEWYAGDHAAFVFQGISCLVATSSDLFHGALEYTHTPKDTLDVIDINMVKPAAEYLTEVILDYCEKARI